MYQNNKIYTYNELNNTWECTHTKPRRKRRKNNYRKMVAVALSCAIIGGAVGASGAFLFMDDEIEMLEVYQASYVDDVSIKTMSSVSSTVLSPTELYEQNVGACVGITVSNLTTNAFGQVSTAASSGSGFVITEDGYVVTNCHVIADAIDSDSLTMDVSFYDGTTYPATLVGYEEDNDVAVLKIEATGLQTIVLGDSDDLEVGETVYAIGNPLGELTFSLTDGLVSALDRLISTDDGSTMNMFQTNTAINPGNSGGPLFNASGDVIGITTAKYSTSSSGTTVEGLGFALPINDVIEIVVDLMEYGYVTGKPYMGVQVINAEYYGAIAGAAISYIAEGSAAENAGLIVGDIITAIDEITIDTTSAITAALGSYSAGDSAVLTVSRDGETISINIIFDEKNTITEAANQITVEEDTSIQSDIQPSMPNMPQTRP